MKARILVSLLAGAVAGACTGRGADEKPEDEEARAACEARCEQVETCDPEHVMSDCIPVEECLTAPYGDKNPARWDDRCREEALASINCQAHLTCEDWLDYLYGERNDPDTPAQDECQKLGLEEIVCRQADDS